MKEAFGILVTVVTCSLSLGSAANDRFDVTPLENPTLGGPGLARISHIKKRIGAPNQRKLFCDNDFCPIRGTPRCRQSVTQSSLDSHLSDAEKLWEVLTAAR
jgi:hypothetical protein